MSGDLIKSVSEALDAIVWRTELHAPPRQVLQRLIASYLAIVLPEHPDASPSAERTVSEKVSRFINCLLECAHGEDIVEAVATELPQMAMVLRRDVTFALREDPAVYSVEEIVYCYPFVYALALHRLAHRLFTLGVQILPRLLSESAHSHTGIDMHPGAKIGTPFFIDHGTGVVIGGTVEIGNNVRIYQGVTLGALSFVREASGAVVKGEKRHPTIRDGVTLYSGCVVLGGDTVIGENAVIGSNVWITESVAPNTMVTVAPDASRFVRIRR